MDPDVDSATSEPSIRGDMRAYSPSLETSTEETPRERFLSPVASGSENLRENFLSPEISQAMRQRYSYSKNRTPRTLMRLMQQHRDNERTRHRGLNATIQTIAKMVPTHGGVGKETKILMLQRIINYICHLEEHIQHLCDELGLNIDFKNLFLSPHMSRKTGNRNSVSSSSSQKYHYTVSSSTESSQDGQQSPEGDISRLALQVGMVGAAKPSVSVTACKLSPSKKLSVDPPKERRERISVTRAPKKSTADTMLHQLLLHSPVLRKGLKEGSKSQHHILTDSPPVIHEDPGQKPVAGSPEWQDLEMLRGNKDEDGESVCIAHLDFGLDQEMEGEDDDDDNGTSSMRKAAEECGLTSPGQEMHVCLQDIMGGFSDHSPETAGDVCEVLSPDWLEYVSNLAADSEELCDGYEQLLSCKGIAITAQQLLHDCTSTDALSADALLSRLDELNSHIEEIEMDSAVADHGGSRPSSPLPSQGDMSPSTEVVSEIVIQPLGTGPESSGCLLSVDGDTRLNDQGNQSCSWDSSEDVQHSEPLSQDTVCGNSSSSGSQQLTNLTKVPRTASTMVKNTAHMEQLGIHMDGTMPTGQQLEDIVQRLRAPLGDLQDSLNTDTWSDQQVSSCSQLPGNPYFIQPGYQREMLGMPFTWQFHNLQVKPKPPSAKKDTTKASKKTDLEVKQADTKEQCVPEFKENSPLGKRRCTEENTKPTNNKCRRVDHRKTSWMNGFMMYSRLHRRKFIEENPGVHTSNISKMMGQAWRKLSQDAQQPYREKAKQYVKYYLTQPGDPDSENETNLLPQSQGEEGLNILTENG